MIVSVVVFSVAVVYAAVVVIVTDGVVLVVGAINQSCWFAFPF